MTIALPLIALVVLLVVWAKHCPEIREPIPRYVCRKVEPLDTSCWHTQGIAIDIPFDPQRWEDLLDRIGKLGDAIRGVGEAGTEVARHMEHLHFDLMLHDDDL